MHCLTLLALHCIALYCIPIGRRMNMFFLLGAFTWQSFVVLQIITNPGVSAKIVHFVLRVCFNVHFVGVFAVYPHSKCDS